MTLPQRIMSILAALAVLPVASAALASDTEDLPQVQEALYTDLGIIVETREKSQWVADRFEVQEASNLALRSVCRTPLESHQALEAWLANEITRMGGPAKDRYLKQGRSLDGLSDLIRTERIHRLAKHTLTIRNEDCPFWIQPTPDFNGIHQSSYRFVLMGESMGGGSLFLRDGEYAFGGGGAFRLLPAFGLSRRITLAIGGELGGQGRFSPDGNGGQELSADFHLAGVMLLRYQKLSQLFDVELGITQYFDDEGFDETPGGRVAIAYGFATPRLGSFMPYAVLFVGYELYPGRANDPMTHVLRAGTRVGVSFDP